MAQSKETKWYRNLPIALLAFHTFLSFFIHFFFKRNVQSQGVRQQDSPWYEGDGDEDEDYEYYLWKKYKRQKLRRRLQLEEDTSRYLHISGMICWFESNSAYFRSAPVNYHYHYDRSSPTYSSPAYYSQPPYYSRPAYYRYASRISVLMARMAELNGYTPLSQSWTGSANKF